MKYSIYKSPSEIRNKLFNFVTNDKSGRPVFPCERNKETKIEKQNWTADTRNKKSDIEFVTIFTEFFEGYHNFVKEEFNLNVDWDNVWYQVYQKNSGDGHHFHDHIGNGVVLSNVIYLEMKGKDIITEFEIDGEVIIPEVEEGDTLIFDSSLKHRSPPNYTDHRKTIVSFNSTK